MTHCISQQLIEALQREDSALELPVGLPLSFINYPGRGYLWSCGEAGGAFFPTLGQALRDATKRLASADRKAP